MLKEILKNNKFELLGIRGSDSPYEIGQTLEESNDWTYDPEYGGNETLDGTCVTKILDTDNGSIYYLEGKELVDAIESTIAWHKDNYCYKYLYLVGSDAFGMSDPNDDNEAIFVNPEVLIEIGGR